MNCKRPAQSATVVVFKSVPFPTPNRSFTHVSSLRPSPDLVRLAVTSATVLRVFSSPGQNASLRPVPFYCYFVYCDRLTACAGRDLVAYLPDCLAGLSCVSRVSPIWSSFMSSWLKSPITWPPSSFHTTPTHTLHLLVILCSPID